MSPVDGPKTVMLSIIAVPEPLTPGMSDAPMSVAEAEPPGKDGIALTFSSTGPLEVW